MCVCVCVHISRLIHINAIRTYSFDRKNSANWLTAYYSTNSRFVVCIFSVGVSHGFFFSFFLICEKWKSIVSATAHIISSGQPVHNVRCPNRALQKTHGILTSLPFSNCTHLLHRIVSNLCDRRVHFACGPQHREPARCVVYR